MIKRIYKMLGTLGVGVFLGTVVQIALPPTFIHCYGVRKYGEWLVLSAMASYLSTLNFGITTYASNQLTMLRKRGDAAAYRELQGSTLAMLLSMIGLGAIVISTIFIVPIDRMLQLSTMSAEQVKVTAFCLGMVVLANIFAGYYSNLFMVIEQTHRGVAWAAARWFSASLCCVPLALLRVQFSVIALGQLAVTVGFCLLTIHDLKRRMGGLPLGVKGANWKTAKAAIAPSGMFAMILTQQFLVFQAPLILLQRRLGPEAVVLFSVSRTILSTARQLLTPITSSIAPEITYSFAVKDMKKLLDVFHYSERTVFAAIPVANLGAFLFAPILLRIWLHKPELFDAPVYGLMALISGAMSMREHKQYFQFATNTHERLSAIVFCGNILMVSVSVPCIDHFGVFGFMCCWLLSEVSQMGLIYHENRKLFDYDPSINLVPVLKLVAVMLVSLLLCNGLIRLVQHQSMLQLGAMAMAGVLGLGVECYFVFGLKSVIVRMQRGTRLDAVSS